MASNASTSTLASFRGSNSVFVSDGSNPPASKNCCAYDGDRKTSCESNPTGAISASPRSPTTACTSDTTTDSLRRHSW
eukprot:19866-Pelagococcus_subviridis.AAC.2